MPEEICSLQLENLEVNCEVECACCTACGEGSTGSEAGGTGSEAGGTGSGSDSGSGSNNDLSGDPTYGLIVARYPEGAEALADASSPQRAAFEWLKSPSNAQVTSDQRLLQRYALASLFYVTGGTSWRSTASWLSEADECLWYTTAETGMLCDSDGNLLEINLRNNNLQGSLPMELLLLANTLGKKHYGSDTVARNRFCFDATTFLDDLSRIVYRDIGSTGQCYFGFDTIKH